MNMRGSAPGGSRHGTAKAPIPAAGGPLHGAGRPCCRRAGGGGGGALAEPAALAALLKGGTHGYDLRKEIADLTGGELEVDAGGLYRVLRRLEDDGYVVSSWSEGDSGPQRRDYELTSNGRMLASDWVAHLHERQRVTGLLADVLSAALEGAL
ncbi:MAG: PadR family transcriptional regulator [Coriobacteriia bacterium]|nr:PadR family transcriptional regulator [Coriobacteriia bacterium]